MIRFTQKEEITLAIIILILLCDLILSQDSDRFYFLHVYFKKIIIHIPGINNYFPTKMTFDQLVTDKFSSVEKALKLFNYKITIDNFQIFSLVYFKNATNFIANSALGNFLFKIWRTIFKKHSGTF